MNIKVERPRKRSRAKLYPARVPSTTLSRAVPVAATREFRIPGSVFSAARLPTIPRVPPGSTNVR
jgi:hypothetical protein